MIILHPLQVAQFEYMFGNKIKAFKWWLKLLRPPIFKNLDTGLVYSWWRVDKIPWCGWKDFWRARPWVLTSKI